jgi:hypothetical protein
MSFVQFQFETDDGELLDCCVELSMYIDKNYGADADGNRGTQRVFTEVCRLRYVCDEDGNDITERVNNEKSLLREILDAAIYEYQNN